MILIVITIINTAILRDLAPVVMQRINEELMKSTVDVL
ncbi:hypothetical protein HMPREF1565_3109 [Providencia alcalifaciens RIMD 1656011]|uniref:Uncharacterized protein n=1 Tax=Providencia alcalifaciens 205/92 TaxID=1256988 RepID=A0AAV3M9Z0_9GAMM|nr:hypothetical protein HMPREF1565_3109 [Providencia alcalifaciens RIMD 1656011]EUD08917.1 hypothetical protein HMPREF1564_1557 [Providencia alcalifaciens R90-1475]EUD12484.1 hypothetical protein HMPREF1563_3772 [Providencia alcalifaciens 205/92]